MNTCRLCLLPKKLSRSHVIPEFLYELTYHDGTFKSVTSDPRHPVRSMQVGFREFLLCEGCEAHFNRWETPVAALLRRILTTKAPARDDLVLFADDRLAQFFDCDPATLKLCALSILWRCHVAGKHTFKKIDLGPHAEVIRQILWNDDPGATSDYPVALFRLLDSPIAAQTLTPPGRKRFKIAALPAMNGYLMRAMGFEWLFVVCRHGGAYLDRQPFVGGGAKLMVGSNYLNDTRELITLRDRVDAWGKL